MSHPTKSDYSTEELDELTVERLDTETRLLMKYIGVSVWAISTALLVVGAYILTAIGGTIALAYALAMVCMAFLSVGRMKEEISKGRYYWFLSKINFAPDTTIRELQRTLVEENQ